MDLDLQSLYLALGDTVSRALDGDPESRSQARSELRRLLDHTSEIRHQIQGAAPEQMRALLAIVLAAEDAWVKLEKESVRR